MKMNEEIVMRKLLVFGLVGLSVGVLLPACGPLIRAAFDTTGVYEGTWKVSIPNSNTETPLCPVTIELAQNVNARFPDNLVLNGVASLGFNCLTANFPIIPAQELEISGVMEPSGRVFLSSPDILSECPEGEVCVRIALEGTGHDDNNDGMMDRLSGSWIMTYTTGGTTVPAPGTFSVEVVTE